ncbi:MAG: hypothetical protein AB2598_20960 [Candidatus Thiodiazotropha sp.]
MEDAAVMYFRTGELPVDWPGIDMPDYYKITDESAGTIEFIADDKHYKLIKSTLRNLGFNLDTIKTLDELTTIEQYFLPEICNSMSSQRKNTPGSLNDAYINTLSYWDNRNAKRLLKIIYEKDRKGFKIISNFNAD